MRFFEIAARPLIALVSTRFEKHFAAFARANLGLDATLFDFVKFKTNSPNELHSRKDTGFANSKLRAYRHEHLMLGKVIIIYQIVNGQLRLCDCMEHKSFDGPAATRKLEKSLVGLTDASFTPYEPPHQKPHGLSPQEKKELATLLYDLAAKRDPAMQGDTDALKQWISLIPLDWDDVLKSFGGPDGLRREISTIRRNLGQARAD